MVKTVKRCVMAVVCAVLLMSLCHAVSGDVLVYITLSEAEYHRASCRYLNVSCIAITLQDATDKGYTPCSRCAPPILTESSQKQYIHLVPIEPQTTQGQSPPINPNERRIQDSRDQAAAHMAETGVSSVPALNAGTRTASRDEQTRNDIIAAAVASFLVGVCLMGVLAWRYRCYAEKEISEARETLRRLQRTRTERRIALLAKYDNKPVRFVFCLPENMSCVDGFPRARGWSREDYKVILPYSGECFHRPTCRAYTYIDRQVKIWDVPSGYRPCSFCRPKVANFSWYRKLQKVEFEARMEGLKMEIESGVIHLLPDGLQPPDAPVADTSSADTSNQPKICLKGIRTLLPKF